MYVRDIERVRSDTRMATPATQHTWNSMQWAWRIVNVYSFDTVTLTHTHTLARVWRVKEEKRELKHKMLMSMRACVMCVCVCVVHSKSNMLFYGYHRVHYIEFIFRHIPCRRLKKHAN